MADPRERGGKARGGLAQRLLWFAALWLAGVGVVALLALVIRAALRA